MQVHITAMLYDLNDDVTDKSLPQSGIVIIYNMFIKSSIRIEQEINMEL